MSEELKSSVTLDLRGLDRLARMLKLSVVPVVQVGVLGGSGRKGAESNADIGAHHEFGTKKVPQRSWLRMPLSTKLQEYLDKSGMFTEATLAQCMKQGTVVPWLERVGIVAERVVQDAFSTGGFGRWRRWKKGYENNTGQILVDTQQLRNSVTSRVKE